MIVLDTNVISEMMRVTPSIKVSSWIDQQEVTHLFITTITIAEITYGINSLPKGKKRQKIENAFNKIIKDAFKHRVLSFSENAAHIYGKIMGRRKELGRPLSILDGQIAATTLAEEYALATRNVRDFRDCDISLINPFE